MCVEYNPFHFRQIQQLCSLQIDEMEEFCGMRYKDVADLRKMIDRQRKGTEPVKKRNEVQVFKRMCKGAQDERLRLFCLDFVWW